MKYFLMLVLGFFVFSTSPLKSQEYPTKTETFYSYSPELEPIIQKLFLLPEARQLLNEIQKEGAVTVRTARLGANVSNAMWSGKDRTIFLNTTNTRSYGTLLRSILFEMHNAKTDRQFMDVDRQAELGYLSKWAYVEAIERMEHQNALNTYYLLEKGIQLGYFPKDARWPVPKDFDEHYACQLATGHSAFIASVFDQMHRSYS